LSPPGAGSGARPWVHALAPHRPGALLHAPGRRQAPAARPSPLPAPAQPAWARLRQAADMTSMQAPVQRSRPVDGHRLRRSHRPRHVHCLPELHQPSSDRCALPGAPVAEQGGPHRRQRCSRRADEQSAGPPGGARRQLAPCKGGLGHRDHHCRQRADSQGRTAHAWQGAGQYSQHQAPATRGSELLAWVRRIHHVWAGVKCACKRRLLSAKVRSCHPPKAMPCCVTASVVGPSSAALHSRRCALCWRRALPLAGGAAAKAGGPRQVRPHACSRLLEASIVPTVLDSLVYSSASK